MKIILTPTSNDNNFSTTLSGVKDKTHYIAYKTKAGKSIGKMDTLEYNYLLQTIKGVCYS